MIKLPNNLKKIGGMAFADSMSMVISASFWFFIGSQLEPDEYGKIMFYISISNIASVISLMGATNALMIYPSKNINLESTFYVLTLVIGFFSSLVIFLMFYNIGSSLLVIGLVIYGLVTSELIGRKLFNQYSKFILLQRIVMVSITISLYQFIGKEWILLGVSISYFPLIYQIIMGLRRYKINIELLKQKIEFIKYAYLENILGSGASYLDRIIIPQLFGFTVLGHYSLGLQFFNLLVILPLIVTKYIIPNQISDNNSKLKLNTLIFSVCVTIISFVIGPQVIESFFPKFDGLDNIIRIISLGVIPIVISQVYFYPKFLALEKSKTILWNSILSILTSIILIILLGQIYGQEGVVIAFVTGTVVSAIHYFISNKKLKNKTFRKNS